MWARVSTITGSPENADLAVKLVQETVIPTAKQWQRYKGGWWLQNRDTCKMIAITIWETEEALQASTEAANQLRGDTTQEIGGQIESVETYEVVVQA